MNKINKIMGSFSKLLKSAIFEESEEKEKQISPPPVQQVVQPTPTLPPSPVTTTVTKDNLSLVDPNLLEKLEKKLEDENLPGPDYLELKEAAEDEELIKEEPDESKRYCQSYKNMKKFFPKSGVSKESILTSIDKYIGVIVVEKNTGYAQLDQKKSLSIDNEKLVVADLSKEIDELEAKLEEKKKIRDEKNAAIQKNIDEFGRKELAFSSTIDYMIGVLKKDKEKINNYIDDGNK